MQKRMLLFVLFVYFVSVGRLQAMTGYPQGGEPMWYVAKGAASAVDQLMPCSYLGTYTMIASIHRQLTAVSTQLDAVQGCSPYEITTPTTINASGYYALCNSLTLASGNAITINASDVTVDLNGWIIRNSGTATNGIVVNAGISRCHIQNGTIQAMTQSGVLLQGSRNTVQNCDLVANTTGVQLISADSNLIFNCRANANKQAGVALVTSNKNYVSQSKALNTVSSTNNAYGFFSYGGMCNTFDGCTAAGTQLTITDTSLIAAGFNFAGAESKSGIVNCSSAFSATPLAPAGAASSLPFGIRLESGFAGSLSLLNQATTSNNNSVHWSPDGKYLAVGCTGSPQVRVFSFDGLGLQLVATAVHGAQVNEVHWSWDGNYLAIAGNWNATDSTGGRIYQFDGVRLTQVATAPATGTPNFSSVDWTYNNKYLAFGFATADGSTNNGNVYQFLGSKLQLVTSINSSGNPVNTVSWTNDATYLAAGGQSTGGPGSFVVRVFSFNGSTLTTAASLSASNLSPVQSVDWSNNGRHLVMGGGGSSSNKLYVYQFTGSALVQTSVGIAGLGIVYSVHFSPNSRFIAVGSATTSQQLQIYSFNTDGTITLLSSQNIGTRVNSANWSPSQLYVAAGLNTSVAADTYVYNIQTTGGCSQCAVKNCVVNCIAGGTSTGIGINANTLANTVLGNYVAECDLSYLYVDNVYASGLFGTPTLLQNIGTTPRY